MNRFLSGVCVAAIGAVACHGALADPLYKDLTPSFQGNDQLSDRPDIKSFLAKDEKELDGPFPYRMNIFTQGTVDKNKAGVRVSEQAAQIAKNDFGQVFYYELLPSAMRVPHWHGNGNEVGTVTSGRMRVQIWEKDDKPAIYYIEPGQTWFIPKGKLHSLENAGTDQLKFIVVYDNPVTADRDFVTAWASLPDAMLAKAVGLTEADIAHIKKTTVNRLSDFERKIEPEKEYDPKRFKSDLTQIKPLFASDKGIVTRLDSNVNPNMKKQALQRTILKPGAMRVPHWYLSGDVLLYVNNGIGYFSMMDDDGVVYHRLIRRGDLISMPKGIFNGFVNVGRGDLEIYEAFNNLEESGEITLMSGSQQFTADVIVGTTKLSEAAAKKLLANPPIGMIVPLFD